MKVRKAFVPAFVALVALCAASGAAEKKSPAEEFADQIAMFAKAKGNALTDAERQSLIAIQPVLQDIARNDEVHRKFFWCYVAQAVPKEIEWAEAEKLISSGKIIAASHVRGEKPVSLTATDGARYRAVEPEKESAEKLIKETDPTGVFVSRRGFDVVLEPGPAAFAERVADFVKHRRLPTPEEKQSLITAHPVLQRVAQMDGVRKFFWSYVSQASDVPKAISWDEAADLVKTGKVVMTFQTHALSVELGGADGISYKTKEPKIDELWKLTRKVDPKGLFILLGTE